MSISVAAYGANRARSRMGHAKCRFRCILNAIEEKVDEGGGRAGEFEDRCLFLAWSCECPPTTVGSIAAIPI
eukprot:4097901-Pyramimonas_sp.AAC.1